MPLPSPELIQTTLREDADEASWDRGQRYYDSGSVRRLINRTDRTKSPDINRIDGQVTGSAALPYHVRLTLDRTGIKSATCTCPYDWGGWCKHIVAVGLTCIYEPETIEKGPPIDSLLAPLSRDNLQDLILQLIEEQPELITPISIAAQHLANQRNYLDKNPITPANLNVSISIPSSPTLTSSKPTLSQKSTNLNLAPYRQRAKQIIRDCINHLESGEDEYYVATDSELSDLIDEALAYSTEGNPVSSFAILESITDTLADNWEDMTNYGIESSEAIDLLDPAWAEAILTQLSIAPQDLDRPDLCAKLELWDSDAFNYSFDLSITALGQGWDDEALLGVLAGTQHQLWPKGERPSYADDLAQIRLGILNDQERWSDYINFARAERQEGDYITMLIDRDRIADVGPLISQLTRFNDIKTIAHSLRDHGALTEALQAVQRGMKLVTDPMSLRGLCLESWEEDPESEFDDDDLDDKLVDESEDDDESQAHMNRFGRFHTSIYATDELALWGSELAEELGELTQAIDLRRTAFQLKPTIQGLKDLETLTLTAHSTAQWSQIKTELITTLRTEKRHYNTSDLIDIYLAESLVEDAIRVVSTYQPETDLLRVMKAAIPVNPDWVIRTATAEADRIIKVGKADRYDWATTALEQLRNTYRHLDRDADWYAYSDQLVSLHSRKSKLMGLMRSKKLLR
jgi:uncharacterized Zn finger protein